MSYQKGILLYMSLFICVVSNKLLPKDSPCTWKGLKGRCVPIHQCRSTDVDMEMGQTLAICKSGKNPDICCTDCDLISGTRKPVNTQFGQRAKHYCVNYQKRLSYPCKHSTLSDVKYLDNERKCYKYESYTHRVSGGMDAERDEFPFMALLGHGESEAAAQCLCGGTVISDNFILTAAHCTAMGPQLYARLGILKRSDPQEMWQIYKVKTVIPYPKYNSNSKYHDIALLKTEKRISFNEHVVPACLQYDMEGDDTQAIVVGWGAIEFRGPIADTLQTATVDKFNKLECQEQYPSTINMKDGFSDDIQMCYGNRNGISDTCDGDSGGPLLSTNPINCLHTVIGVTSFGKGCGFVGNSGVYTRVRPYLSWIESVVWPQRYKRRRSVRREMKTFQGRQRT